MAKEVDYMIGTKDIRNYITERLKGAAGFLNTPVSDEQTKTIHNMICGEIKALNELSTWVQSIEEEQAFDEDGEED